MISELVLTRYSDALVGLDGQLRKAFDWCRTNGKTPEELLDARLAPDMFPLSAQIAFTCLQARECLARLAGAPLPSVPSVGSEVEALAAIEAAKNDLATAERSLLDADPEGPLVLELPNGLVFDFTRFTYVRDWALPQFHFHAVTAYAVMRHAGVDLGKADYVPHVLRYMRH